MAGRNPVLRWTAEVQRASKRHGIPVAVLLALIEVESGGNPNAVSSAGARGTTQFMPGTAPSYGVKFGDSPAAVRSQIDGAARYLIDLGYKKDRRRALGGYNGGPGNPQYGYADKVLAAAKKYGNLAATPTRPTGRQGATSATTSAAGAQGAPIGPDERSGALKALLWVTFVAAGLSLTGLGTARMLGLKPSQLLPIPKAA